MKQFLQFLLSIPLIIVNPTRVLTLFQVKNLDQRTNKILENDRVVKILALVGAIVFVVSIRYTPATPAPVYSETLTIPVERILNEHYTDLGSAIPQQVELTLSGNPAQVTMLRQTRDFRAILDLDALGPGEHANAILRLNEELPAEVTAILNPPVVNDVEIARLEEDTFKVVILPELPELPDYHRYSFGDIAVYPPEVTIRGPQRVLDEIEEVIVRIRVTADMVTPGTITGEVQVVPLRNHEWVRGVDVTPEFVSSQVIVHDLLRMVDIELSENLLNFPPNRYIFNDLTIDQTEIGLWGDFDALANWELYDQNTGTIMLPRLNFRDFTEGILHLVIELPTNVFAQIGEETVTNFEITVRLDYEEVPVTTAESEDADD